MILNYGSNTLTIEPKDESYRYRAIKGEHTLTLYFDMPSFIDLPIGTWTIYEGKRYELQSPEEFKKNGTREFEYTLVMRTEQDYLNKWKIRHPLTNKLKFSFVGTPAELLSMLVENLNMRDSGWAVGSCIDATQQLVTFNHSYCSEALQEIADAFETEWEFVGKTINLHRVEHNKDAPLALSYGRGNGFLPGTGRVNYDEDKKVEILYVQGGDRNIDAQAYGATELLLPKNQVLTYEGRTYIVDADGYYIQRQGVALTTGAEDSLDLSHIYPMRIGTVSGVDTHQVTNEDGSTGTVYDILDSSIPADLDFEQCLINGESMTIMFQSGI